MINSQRLIKQVVKHNTVNFVLETAPQRLSVPLIPDLRILGDGSKATKTLDKHAHHACGQPTKGRHFRQAFKTHIRTDGLTRIILKFRAT